MGYLKEAILRIEEDKTTLKIDFSEIMTAITTLQTRKTFPQYRAARDKLYALAYENPVELVPIIAAYLEKIGNDKDARIRSHMHLTNAIVICREEIRPDAAADEKERAQLEARRAEALAIIARLCKAVPVGHVLNLMLVGEKGEAEDAHLALGWLDHFQGPESRVALKALRMLTEALEKVRRDTGMAAAQRTLYLLNGSSAVGKLVKIHPDHPYVGEGAVRLLCELLGGEEDEIRYNAGHVLANIMRLSPTWHAQIDFYAFGKLLANLEDSGHPLAMESAFEAIETMVETDPAFDATYAAHLAWRLGELAGSEEPAPRARATRALEKLLARKAAELGRLDACVPGLLAADGADPARMIRGLAPLADIGVEEVEVAAVGAIRALLDAAARRSAEPLAEETLVLVQKLVGLGAGKPLEFKTEIERILGNKLVKRAVKRVGKRPDAVPSDGAPGAGDAARKPRPETWNASILAYCTENPVGEEIQRHLRLTAFDFDALLKKATDKKVGGFAITALRDSYRARYAAQLGARDVQNLAIAILRSLSRYEDPVKVATARDLLLRLEEDLQAADRAEIWEIVHEEIGKGLNDPSSEMGPLAMKALCLLSGQPRESTAIFARIPASFDMDGDLVEGKIVRPPKK
jgi:hypothetical protein